MRPGLGGRSEKQETQRQHVLTSLTRIPSKGDEKTNLGVNAPRQFVQLRFTQVRLLLCSTRPERIFFFLPLRIFCAPLIRKFRRNFYGQTISQSHTCHDQVGKLVGTSEMELSRLFSVKDKVVLLTGGGRGIGFMLAEGFVRNGAKVYIVSRNTASCKTAAEKLNEMGPGKCIALSGANLGKEEECKKVAAEFATFEKHLDILINNSGFVSFFRKTVDTHSLDVHGEHLLKNILLLLGIKFLI